MEWIKIQPFAGSLRTAPRLVSDALDRRNPLCYQPRQRFRVFAEAAERPFRGPRQEARALVQIYVRDNNVEQALKALKKKMQREGTFREMKRRSFYEKPSEKRARQKAEAVRRARKLARKRAQREGLIAAKPR